jgi:hypothetical protein
MSTLQQLDDLLPDYQYVDDERIVLTVGLRATFYFWQGHSVARRNALVECVEAYEQAYGAELRWAFDVERHQAVPIDKMPPIRQRVQVMTQDDQVEWYASSGDDETAACYRISVLTERGWQAGEMSVLSFTLPREHAYAPGKRKKLLELVDLFTECLSPFHGHVGLAAVSTYEQYRYQCDEMDVATRYLGLFIESPAMDVNQAHNGFKSVDWITFVGNSFAQRMGGVDVLGNLLRTQAVNFKETAAGLTIVAGPVADIAPLEKGTPEQLTRINALLRPLRNGAFGSMGFASGNGELRFDRCTSDLWIRRLDSPDVWPPKSFTGLPRTPVGKLPGKKLHVKTGQACVAHGRYRHPGYGPMQDEDDGAPQVVLLPGDIAPCWLQLGPHGEYLGCEAVAWELMSAL